MKLEEFKKLSYDEKLNEMFKVILETEEILGTKSLCAPSRSDLSGVYIGDIIENNRNTTKEENRIWNEKEEEISEVVEI